MYPQLYPFQLLVADVMKQGEWDFTKISEYTSSQIAHEVVKVPIGKVDTPLWRDTNSKQFSSAAAWKLTREHHNPISELSILWHNAIPLKISILNWRLANSLLPVDLKMRGFGIQGPSKCQCCMCEETLKHVFLESQSAKTVWKHYNEIFGMPNVQYTSITSLWLAWKSAHEWTCKGHIRIVIPLVISWAIWCARNEAKHSSRKVVPQQIIMKIDLKIRSLIKANKISYKNCRGERHFCNCYDICRPLHQKPSVLQVCWLKPRLGWIKLNADGCSKGNPGPAAVGGIFRDHLGAPILSYAKALGVQSSYVAELCAVWLGIYIASKVGFKQLWIEMDSLVVVKQITSKHIGCGYTHTIFSRMYRMLEQMNWTCSHVYREANSAADCLANSGMGSQSLLIVFPELFSKVLKGITRLDKMGLPSIRVVGGV